MNVAEWIGVLGGIGGVVGGVAGIAAWVRSGTANRHAGNAVTEAQTANVHAKDAASQARASNVIAKESNVFSQEAVDAAKESNGIAREANRISEKASSTAEMSIQEQREQRESERFARLSFELAATEFPVWGQEKPQPYVPGMPSFSRPAGVHPHPDAMEPTNDRPVYIPVRNEGRCAARALVAKVGVKGDHFFIKAEHPDTLAPDDLGYVHFNLQGIGASGGKSGPFTLTVTYRDDVGPHTDTLRFVLTGGQWPRWRVMPFPDAEPADPSIGTGSTL